jgi:hypothetical protein
MPRIEMITKEEAIKKVRDMLGEDMDVMLDNIVEKEYGWVIFPQSKKYIQTKDPLFIAIGSGGILAEKTTGNTYEFGSAYSTDQNLRIYELGYFQYENWDIEIFKVINKSETIEHLSKLDISYVVPEEEHGTVWKIPKKYINEQLKNKLKSLPVRFNLGNVYFRWEQLESLKTQSDFEYQLSENEGHENGI